MAIITITFEHNDASVPKYKFGDNLAVTDNCQPKDWLTGKVIGLYLDELYAPRWWYAVKLGSPVDYTEEYLGDDLVPQTEIPRLQAQWELGEADAVTQSNGDNQKPAPNFQSGMRVKFTQETGCNLPGNFAEVVSSRYVSASDWSGWVYRLTNKNLTQTIEIGEIWLELVTPKTAEAT